MQIELQHIAKRYRKDWIFRGVSLELEKGSRTAIIGNNGSGKSTLVQIISGFLSPSEGHVLWSLNNLNMTREGLYRHVALCSPALQLWDELTLDENVSLFLRFKKLPSCKSAEDFAYQINLENHRHQTLKTFSSGMKQRVKLGLAILSDADLLLLDEPCSHLDSSAVSWFQSMLQRISDQRTVVIASNRDERETSFCTHTLDMSKFKT